MTRVVALVWLLTAAMAARADVGVTPVTETPGADPRAGQVLRSQAINFDLGEQFYVLEQQGWTRPDDPTFFDDGRPGSLGMTLPSQGGWPADGFLFIQLDGHVVGDVPTAWLGEVEDEPERMLADLWWDHPKALVRCRFAGRDGDDKLLLQIDLAPRAPLGRVEVVLRGAPGYGPDGPSIVLFEPPADPAVRVRLPNQTVSEGSVEVTAADAAWGVIYDEANAPTPMTGACGWALAPGDFTGATVSAAGGQAHAILSADPAATRLRLALWDFTGAANEQVIERMPTAAADALAAFPLLDARSKRLREFDYDTHWESLAPEAEGGDGDGDAATLAWLRAVRPYVKGEQPWTLEAEYLFESGYDAASMKFGGSAWVWVLGM